MRMMVADEYRAVAQGQYKNADTKLWMDRCAERGYTVLTGRKNMAVRASTKTKSSCCNRKCNA